MFLKGIQFVAILLPLVLISARNDCEMCRSQKFGIIKIVMFLKAAFIWSKIQQKYIVNYYYNWEFKKNI